MKAKDLAVKYNENPTPETVIKLAVEVAQETKSIALSRHVKSNSGVAAILRQQDDKWRAFARLCPTVNPNGFKIVLHKAIPESRKLLP